MSDTAPQILWRAAGSPMPAGKTGSKYCFEPCQGFCATCAAPVKEGVPFTPRRGVAGIDNNTFHGHAEFARFGTHVCNACAWLYGEPKRNHRGVIAIGERLEWPLLGMKPDGERPRWRQMMGAIARATPDTPMTGILTTDVKPRLWPRAQAAIASSPGLYVHAPDYDWSAWTNLDIKSIAKITAIIDIARALGASKAACWHGLSGRAPVSSDIRTVIAIDEALRPYKGSSDLLVAVLTA